jgi:hypothetical protein
VEGRRGRRNEKERQESRERESEERDRYTATQNRAEQSRPVEGGLGIGDIVVSVDGVEQVRVRGDEVGAGAGLRVQLGGTALLEIKKNLKRERERKERRGR